VHVFGSFGNWFGVPSLAWDFCDFSINLGYLSYLWWVELASTLFV